MNGNGYMALPPLVQQHSAVQAARAGIQGAEDRHAVVAKEVEELEGQLAALDEKVAAVTAAGDPEGIIRRLTRDRRKKLDKLEEAAADLRAHAAVVDAAVAAFHRAQLDAIAEIWGQQDHAGPVAQLHEHLGPLIEAVDRLRWLSEAKNGLHEMARTIANRRLSGAQVPGLEEVNVGLNRLTWNELRRLLDTIKNERNGATTTNQEAA